MKAIRRALGGNWQKLAENARRYAESNLSRDGILNAYEKVVLGQAV